MQIDWGNAITVAVVGFVTVFVVLAILAVVLWLASKIINRAAVTTAAGKEK